jgi:hypothetical protein
MRGCLLTLRVASGVLAVGMGLASASAKQPEYSEAQTRIVVRGYAKCVVKNERRMASEALLLDVDDERFHRHYKILIHPDCFGRQVYGAMSLGFRGDLLRYALADALVSAELAGLPAPDVASVPPLSRRSPGSPPSQTLPNGKKMRARDYEDAAVEYARKLSAFLVGAYGECVVRADPAGALALLLTEPETPAEAVRLDAMGPALSHCLNKGQTLQFSKESLRGTIALNYYRLARAARGAQVKAAA